MSPGHPKVGESKQRMQLSSVFRKPAVAHFSQSELALDYAGEMLDLGAHTGLELFDSFTDSVRLQLDGHPALARPAGNVPVGLGGQSLARIGKDIGLRSAQKEPGLDDVLNIDSSASQAVDQPGLGIHPNVGLHAKVPLIALLSLMHLRVPCARGILGRAWRRDDRGIQNHALGESQTAARQIAIHRFKDSGSPPMRLQQMPKIQNRRLIRHPPFSQAQSRKAAHRENLIQGLFHGRLAQSLPLLNKVNSDRDTRFIRPSAISCLGINRFNQSLNLFPGHHPTQLGEKELPPRPLALDPVFRIGKTYLDHSVCPKKINMNTRQYQH